MAQQATAGPAEPDGLNPYGCAYRKDSFSYDGRTDIAIGHFSGRKIFEKY